MALISFSSLSVAWGGVRVFADGGVMSLSPAAHDPSVA